MAPTKLGLVCLAALSLGAAAAPSPLLLLHPAADTPSTKVSYESLSQAKVLAGVLAAAGGGVGAEQWLAGAASPRLLAVLLRQAGDSTQVRRVQTASAAWRRR